MHRYCQTSEAPFSETSLLFGGNFNDVRRSNGTSEIMFDLPGGNIMVACAVEGRSSEKSGMTLSESLPALSQA